MPTPAPSHTPTPTLASKDVNHQQARVQLRRRVQLLDNADLKQALVS